MAPSSTIYWKKFSSMKHFCTLIVLVLFFLPSVCISQTITLDDLKKFSKNQPDYIAEDLIDRGFEASAGSYWRRFEKESKGEGISVLFEGPENWMPKGQVILCFSEDYENEYDNLIDQVKKRCQKTSFFFSNNLKTYVSEYYSPPSTYIYVFKGYCMNLEMTYKYGSIILTSGEADHIKD